jgi:trehalose 6-phosphate phosphatase
VNPHTWSAVIMDMDGVITRTAGLHAQAWKQTFDPFLERRNRTNNETHAPFDIVTDYRRYVDGRPRLDGIRSFLNARGIALPEGGPDDDQNADTVNGLGRRKNALFLEQLKKEGIEAYEDAIECVGRWRQDGLRTALITSSRNGRAISEAAGVRDLFDELIDGVDASRSGLRGKPAPDVYLEAARRLGVQPADAIVVEDAIAGVEAARSGGFGRVVGVARDGAAELREHGADIVVRDLRQL